MLVRDNVLPALLAILGAPCSGRRRSSPARPTKAGSWGKVAQRVIARPAQTLAVGVVVFGALAFGPCSMRGGLGGPRRHLRQ